MRHRKSLTMTPQKIIDDDPLCQKNEYSVLWRRLDALRKNNIYFGAIS